MGYQVALNKAWNEVKKINKQDKLSVKFLGDEYEIDTLSKRVLSCGCNVLAKDFVAILILHYLVRRIAGLPALSQDWISFKQLPGGLGYYGAFRRRSLEPIIRKYGKDPQQLVSCLERLPGRKIEYGDCGIVIDVFEGVPFLVTVFQEDEEFSAEANMFFDDSISQVFCSEDIAVLAAYIAGQI
jgi:hypothetical protein